MNNSGADGAVLFVGCVSRPAKLQARTEQPVVVAQTLDGARKRIHQGDITCVVSEHLLEDGTGLELLEAIRDDFPVLPFLLWTADGSEEIASRAITAGVTDYIVHDGELDTHAIDHILNRVEELDQVRSETLTSREQRVLDQSIDTCPTGITVVGSDGDVVWANDRAEEILGIPRDEITDHVFDDPAWEIITWDGEPIPDGELPARRVQATGEAIYGKKLGVKRPDGERTWLLVNSAPITAADDGGTEISVVNAFEDVTEQRHQEKRLERSERKFRAVFEEAFDAMMIADDNTEYVDVNPSACELFGLPREELLSRSIAEFAPDDYDFEAAWQEFRESDQDRGLFPLVRPDGEERIVEFAATPDILPGRHLSVLRDVTDRQEAKEQLQEERDQAQRYLDIAGDMMVALNPDGEVTLVNQRACDLLGYEEAEIIGQDWFDTFVRECDRAETRAGFEELMAGNTESVEQFENAVVTSDGDKRTIEWYNKVLRDDEGGITGTLSSGTDITERKQFEETITALYDSAHELLGTETKDEVSEVVVNTVTDILDISGVVMYLYDDEGDHLYPSAQSVNAEFMREEFPAVPADDSSITGHVYTTGEPQLFDDITESPYLQTDATNMRSGLFVPIGTQGILIVGSQEVGTFDDQTQELFELLAANAEAVYDRVEHFSQLQSSKERLSLALDAADAGVWEWNDERDEMTWDENLERLFGIESRTFEGTYEGFVKRVHPDDRSDVEEALRQALDQTGSFKHEFRIIRDDGQERWIHGQGLAVREANKPRRFLGIGIDITERKKHEEDPQLFRNLVDHSLDGINAIDPETAEILEVNEASCRMLGYDRSELLSMSVPDINPEFSMDMWDEFVESVKKEGQKVIESTHQRKDGSTFPVEIKISWAPLDSAYHVAAVRDITERKKREQELKSSEEKFRSLIETAPDPIFVADTETGEIVETNTAACEIRKQSRDEIIGLHQTALHPEEDADRYEALFERHSEQGSAISEFPDGSPIYLRTADGERIPVEISIETVHLDNRTLVHGIFRDVSEQKRYEKSLETLNRAAQDFLAAETDHEIAQTTVNIADDVLGFSGVAVYFYDEDNGVLRPAAYPTATEELLGEMPTFSPGDSIAWRVYTTQEHAVFDDVRSDDDVYNPGTPIRSELVIPLGEHGVFLAGDPEIGAFDDLTVELADVLTTTAQAALNRVDWARQLQEQEREAQLHAGRLERVNQLNEKIRSIIQAIVHAETRPDIEQAICDALVEIDHFDFAWIGTPDFVASELQPSSWAGKTSGYLESISLDLNSDGGAPSLTAAQQRETTVVSNIAGSLQQDSWRQEALLEDYRSVISVPILHEEVMYGVLTIYGSQPSTFDDMSTTVLTDLGELIGYALNAVEKRSTFHDTSLVELTFELSEREGLFITLASRLAIDLEIRNITPRPDGSYLVYLLAPDVDPDRFTDEVHSFTTISEVRSIGDAESGQFELIVSESCLVTDAAEFAPMFHSITVFEQDGRISITIPQDRDAKSFIAQFRDQYTDVTLVGRQDTERDRSSLGPSSLLDHLTTRQQEVLKAAYYGGFFDRPRKSTGSEIADSLGISQPAFSKQLRKGERKLLKPLYDPD